MRKLFYALLSVFCVLALFTGFLYRVQIKKSVEAFFKADVPSPKPAIEFKKTNSKPSLQKNTSPPQKLVKTVPRVPVVTPSQVVPAGSSSAQQKPVFLPASVNLDIPFGSQAPFANWGMPYQEACEEAAAIMVHRFFTGEPLDANIMDNEILKLVSWEKSTFGYYEDTTAAEIGRIMREYFGHKDVEVRYQFTIDDIKREVSQGHPVILPAAGRLLPNPNFRQPGPLYHALVVKGYTRDKIITNDPGTRKGKDFLYDPKSLMAALHEWDPVDILKGRPAMIVVRD